jgi:hypothetical protein
MRVCRLVCVVTSFLVVLTALLVSISSASADEPDVDSILAAASKAIPYRDAWERCAAAAVKRDLSSDLTPEALADRAVSRCRPREMRLRAVLSKSVGAVEAQTVVEQLRRVYRSNLETIVEDLRKRR